MKVNDLYFGNNSTVGAYSYFYERIKNDINGNPRYTLTVIYRNIVLTNTVKTYSAFLGDRADAIITDYYIKNLEDIRK